MQVIYVFWTGWIFHIQWCWILWSGKCYFSHTSRAWAHCVGSSVHWVLYLSYFEVMPILLFAFLSCVYPFATPNVSIMERMWCTIDSLAGCATVTIQCFNCLIVYAPAHSQIRCFMHLLYLCRSCSKSRGRHMLYLKSVFMNVNVTGGALCWDCLMFCLATHFNQPKSYLIIY